MNNIKQKALITDIENRKDKNQQDYWIIRTQLDERTNRSYLAFAGDYNINPRARSLLDNYPEQIVNKMVVLTLKKQEGDNLEKVIDIEVEKGGNK